MATVSDRRMHGFLKRWEAIGLAALTAVGCLGVVAYTMGLDLASAEQRFQAKTRLYEQEIVRRFGNVDAILTSLSSLYALDPSLSHGGTAPLAARLQQSYDYIDAIDDFGVARIGADLELTWAPDDENGFESVLIVHDGLIEAVTHGRPAIVSVPPAVGRPRGLAAVQAVYNGKQSPATVEARRADVVGAIVIRLRNNAFFDTALDDFSHVSVWAPAIAAADGPAEPIFERDFNNHEAPSPWLIEPLETAIKVNAGGRDFWIAASAPPRTEDFRLGAILLAVLAPIAIGAVCFVAVALRRMAQARAEADAAKLSRSERRFKDFADASVDWYWEMDSELRCSFLSERHKEMTGVEPEALLGKTREESGIPDIDPDIWRDHLATLKAHKPFRDFVHPRRFPNGRQVWLNVNGKPVFDENGDFLGYRGTGRDITAVVRREKELADARAAAESANRAKSAFLAAMSHELRTPLNAVIGFSEILRKNADGRETDPDRLEFAEMIHASGVRLLNLINDLLEVSKIDSGQDKLTEKPVDLPHVIAAAIRQTAAKQPKDSVEITVDAPPAPPCLTADRRKLGQIMANLLSNAVKFTEPGGKVTVRCAIDAAGACVVEVSDTGIGIAAEDIPHAFADFGQIDNALGRNFEGAGLGLPLTRRLVEQHGGAISLESEKGVGSTFRIVFPPERTITAPAAPPETEAPRLRAVG